MSDEKLRELERAHAADPSAGNLLRLQNARVRHGLGWSGEKLPGRKDGTRLVPKPESPGIYLWHVGDRIENTGLEPIDVEFVYVSEGAWPCGRCFGAGEYAAFQTGPETTSILVPGGCPDCQPEPIHGPFLFDPYGGTGLPRGSGRRKIEPFYVSRFPVLDVQFHSFMEGLGHGLDIWTPVPYRNYAPAHFDEQLIKTFCDGTGVRLPTRAEWEWAAFGGCLHDHSPNWACGPACDGGKRRLFPWGNEAATYAHRELPDQQPQPSLVEACSHGRNPWRVLPDGTIEEHWCEGGFKLVPAYPLSASWCGALDMGTNGLEFLADRTTIEVSASGRVVQHHAVWPWLSFRVVLDAV